MREDHIRCNRSLNSTVMNNEKVFIFSDSEVQNLILALRNQIRLEQLTEKMFSKLLGPQRYPRQ